MPVFKKKITVMSKQGLHARPAALFVQVANKFDSQITVSRESEKVDGKSIMGILMLGAEEGSVIYLEAEGDDAQQAILELEKVIVKDE